MLEAIRAEGTSPWFTASHDEAAMVMDGEVEIRLVKLDRRSWPRITKAPRCSRAIPTASRWATSSRRRGHMALLPERRGVSISRAKPGVILLQTIEGDLPSNAGRTSARSSCESIDGVTIKWRRGANQLGYRRFYARRFLFRAAMSTSRIIEWPGGSHILIRR